MSSNDTYPVYNKIEKFKEGNDELSVVKSKCSQVNIRKLDLKVS